MNLTDRIFSIDSEEAFLETSLDVFRYQFEKCGPYGEYCRLLGVNPNKVRKLVEIPFLPIEFFKSKEIYSNDAPEVLQFHSSGTGGSRSIHHIADNMIYERSFVSSYTSAIGKPHEQIILALLPNYQENKYSSLIYMVDFLIKLTDSDLSGYVLNDPFTIEKVNRTCILQNKELVLFGVSYALMDLADNKIDLAGVKIIETGGMKGNRKELTKIELHEYISSKLNTNLIYSEYGMTELLSQAYSSPSSDFKCPPWMRILIREVNDPFSYVDLNKTGGINVIDLANINSCSFISTQDLGRITEGGLELIGRFDNADIRGCNLLLGS